MASMVLAICPLNVLSSIFEHLNMFLLMHYLRVCLCLCLSAKSVYNARHMHQLGPFRTNYSHSFTTHVASLWWTRHCVA